MAKCKMTDIETAIDGWRNLLDESSILVGDAAQKFFGVDTSAFQSQIPAALFISDAAVLPQIMQIAQQNKVAVYPISTGNNWGYGTSFPVTNGCVILDLSKLKKIVHFDPQFGVVTLEPGVTQGMLSDFLKAGNHPFLVPVTGAGPRCSLIGNALERGYGLTPHTDHFAAITDIEAILADGSIYRTAMREAAGEDLARLFRNGIGPYTTGLFTQSGFGIVTRMSIVLARRPESVRVCFFSIKDDILLEDAVERVRAILSTLPGIVAGLNLMNRHRVLAMSASYPVECIGSDGLIPDAVIQKLGKQFQVAPWTGFGTLYGTRSVVLAAQKEIKRALSGVASRLIFVTTSRVKMLSKVGCLIPGAPGKRLRKTVSTLSSAMELVDGVPNETALPLAYWSSQKIQTGQCRDPARDGCGLIWYAPLVPMRNDMVRSYVDMVHRVTRQHGIEPLLTLTSLNDRLFDSTVPLVFDVNDLKAVASATACYEQLIKEGRDLGFFPYRIGIPMMSMLSDLTNDSRKFHARLRLGLDPDNIIAPGRYQ